MFNNDFVFVRLVQSSDPVQLQEKIKGKLIMFLLLNHIKLQLI